MTLPHRPPVLSPMSNPFPHVIWSALLAVPRPTKFGACCLLLALMSMTAGCGDQASYPQTRLTGTVAIDGQPVEQGSLSFTPEGPGPAQAVGALIANGRYTAEKVPLGKVRVLFNATRKTGKAPSEHDKPIPILMDLVPAKYRSGMAIEVQKGQSEQNFDLTSGK